MSNQKGIDEYLYSLALGHDDIRLELSLAMAALKIWRTPLLNIILGALPVIS